MRCMHSTQWHCLPFDDLPLSDTLAESSSLAESSWGKLPMVLQRRDALSLTTLRGARRFDHPAGRLPSAGGHGLGRFTADGMLNISNRYRPPNAYQMYSGKTKSTCKLDKTGSTAGTHSAQRLVTLTPNLCANFVLTNTVILGCTVY